MVLQFAASWRKVVCAMRGMLIIQVSLVLFAGCSCSPKYEKQFNKILAYV